MTRVYDHTKVEKKWSDGWYKDNIFKAEDFSSKPKKYILAEFPYPSGKALHAGHMMRYTVPDVYSRFLRMNGYNVLFPMGYDSFGLPAENFAVKTGIHPSVTTEEAIRNYTESFKRMGYGFDWDREVVTSNPDYYKWTQWMFLKFFEAGLAEYKESPVWWCEELKTVLAEEEVLTDKDGNKISERGNHPVVRKNVKQWTLKITKYADKLIEGLSLVDFPESIKSAQTNWIGRSEGAQITFELVDADGAKLEDAEVYTTRPDTIFGVSFIAISPENSLLSSLRSKISNWEEVHSYIELSKSKTDLERRSSKVKTGVEVKGFVAKHPFSESKDTVPIYVADYVLNDYGTGVIMGVPAHDDRDKEFAIVSKLPIIPVIDEAGQMINSHGYNGVKSSDFFLKVIERLKEESKGFSKVTYKIRDWLFSRQRYWGEPIPVLHKSDGTVEAIVKTSDFEKVNEILPLVLPDVSDFSPTADGNSPLTKNSKWLQTIDSLGNPATRETNTMPNWAGSCWYYIRYLDPKNDKQFADPKKMEYWLPVDKYFGGSEHITLHLLYSRFWHKFLYDQGLLPTQEPYSWRMTGGLLLGPDGRKMSKSIGNIIDPIEMADAYGADALRLYICFIGPYEDTYPWNPSGIKATYKLVSSVYMLKDKVTDAESAEVERGMNTLIKNITYMCDNLKMNTAVSEFMKFTNIVKASGSLNVKTYKKLLILLAPFAPFVTEDLWQELHSNAIWDAKNSIHVQSWPVLSGDEFKEESMKVAVQVNGKVRGLVTLSPTITEEEAVRLAKSDSAISKFLLGTVVRVVYVQGKILSFVTK